MHACTFLIRKECAPAARPACCRMLPRVTWVAKSHICSPILREGRGGRVQVIKTILQQALPSRRPQLVPACSALRAVMLGSRARCTRLKRRRQPLAFVQGVVYVLLLQQASRPGPRPRKRARGSRGAGDSRSRAPPAAPPILRAAAPRGPVHERPAPGWGAVTQLLLCRWRLAAPRHPRFYCSDQIIV